MEVIFEILDAIDEARGAIYFLFSFGLGSLFVLMMEDRTKKILEELKQIKEKLDKDD